MKTNSLILLTFLYLVACATFETNAYRTVNTISIGVDASMRAYGDAVRAGKIGLGDQAKVKENYLKYQASMRVAKDVVTAYKSGGDRTQLDIALSALSLSATNLTTVITLFLK